MMIRLLLVCALLVAGAAFTPAAEAPTLTELQRLQVLTLVQRLQIAELRAQAAQREWNEARAELLAVSERLAVEGYELDLATQTYRPAPRSGARTEP